MEEVGIEVYSQIHPVDIGDVGKCYYCGCESFESDYVPPRRVAPFYLNTGASCSFAIVPVCKECHEFLEPCREGLIEERKVYVNKKIERKYRKALNIYEKWSEDEVSDLSRDLAKSVRAGINLGEEAHDRLVYPGYEYEIDGTVFHARRRKVKTFTVFGEVFDNYRNALQYASRSYRININTLKDWLIDHGGDFDKAINAYHEHQEQERLRKKIEKTCKEFASKHRQHPSFIKGALEAYMEANPLLSMEACLDLIYEERIKKK